MTSDSRLTGPLAGETRPNHGGAPGNEGCTGCVDCCHMGEISITIAEAARLTAAYARLPQPIGPLHIVKDPNRRGWRLMLGPCAFLRDNTPLSSGGCRIYADRPGTCRVFTCELLLNLRRSQI